MAKEEVGLREQLEQMRRVLAAHGIRVPGATDEVAEPVDRVAHGSAEHARMLGLVETGAGGADGFVTFTSERTGKAYRLEDELGIMRYYPGVDPKAAALVVLRQKVNELEMAPSVPADAPVLWRPADMPIE